MVLNILRSSIFNILCFAFNLAVCILYLPALLLPHSIFMRCVNFYLHGLYFLERFILGLTYEVRGAENIPAEGSYLVAAKHYSSYETFKLRLITRDPAIILKKELFNIPLWGWYLRKTRPIAINRQSAKTALNSMIDGALEVKEQNRALVIFPQGTRVKVEETPAGKPYKSGLARIQEATRLPVVMLAHNSGVFAPRKSWIKYPGTVVFEFLPAIPGDTDSKEMMKTVEEKLEAASNALVEEARA